VSTRSACELRPLRSIPTRSPSLFFEDDDGGAVKVFKVDNSEHRAGDVHVDRYYRESSAPRKDFDVDISTLSDAEAYVCANWRRFADRHDANHR